MLGPGARALSQVPRTADILELPQLTGNLWEGESGIYWNVCEGNTCTVGRQRLRWRACGLDSAQGPVQATDSVAQGRLRC